MKLKETQRTILVWRKLESCQVNATNDSEPDQFATKKKKKKGWCQGITHKIWVGFKDEMDMAYQC